MKNSKWYLTFLVLVTMSGLVQARTWKENLAENKTPTVVVLDMYGIVNVSFFGISLGTYPVHGGCSGVAIDPKGVVLTAAHCVDEDENFTLSSFTITTYNGKPALGETILKDRLSDLAIIRTKESPIRKFKIAKISSRKVLRPGEDVMVIGHPLGLYWSVTAGIISYVRRELGTLQFYTQFDAVIAPGNSGGPVFDRKGEIIGITSRYRGGPMGSLTGLNFMCDLTAIQLIVEQAQDVLNGLPPRKSQVRRYKIGDIK